MNIYCRKSLDKRDFPGLRWQANNGDSAIRAVVAAALPARCHRKNRPAVIINCPRDSRRRRERKFSAESDEDSQEDSTERESLLGEISRGGFCARATCRYAYTTLCAALLPRENHYVRLICNHEATFVDYD